MYFHFTLRGEITAKTMLSTGLFALANGTETAFRPQRANPADRRPVRGSARRGPAPGPGEPARTPCVPGLQLCVLPALCPAPPSSENSLTERCPRGTRPSCVDWSPAAGRPAKGPSVTRQHGSALPRPPLRLSRESFPRGRGGHSSALTALRGRWGPRSCVRRAAGGPCPRARRAEGECGAPGTLGS